jgi:hypothetical protein
MSTFLDDPLGLDPFSPLPARDPRWFMPAHPAEGSRIANLRDEPGPLDGRAAGPRAGDPSTVRSS